MIAICETVRVNVSENTTQLPLRSFNTSRVYTITKIAHTSTTMIVGRSQTPPTTRWSAKVLAVAMVRVFVWHIERCDSSPSTQDPGVDLRLCGRRLIFPDLRKVPALDIDTTAEV
jgi:hypothetical protein